MSGQGCLNVYKFCGRGARNAAASANVLRDSTNPRAVTNVVNALHEDILLNDAP
jgi:hypothetical protein